MAPKAHELAEAKGWGRVGTRMRGASLAVEAALRQSMAATLDCELLFHRSTDEPDKIDGLQWNDRACAARTAVTTRYLLSIA